MHLKLLFTAFISISGNFQVMEDTRFVSFQACLLISDDFLVITDWDTHVELLFTAFISINNNFRVMGDARFVLF